MPNWMDTRCIVTGPADAILAFRSKVFRKKKRGRQTTTEFDFQQIIPRPALLDTMKKSEADKLGEVLLGLRPEWTLNRGGLSDDLIEKIQADVGMPGEIWTNRLAEAFLAKHPRV